MDPEEGTASLVGGAITARSCTVHGVFLNVFAVGTLLMGESGVGKSECALELVSCGHALVADDAVNIQRTGDLLYGESAELLSGLLEIRGIGIVDVRQMFGPASVVEKQVVKLCIEFQDRNAGDEDDRIAAGMQEFELLGVKLPRFVFAVGHGRPLALLVETAVKLFKQENAGYAAESDLAAKYNNAISARSESGS